MKHHIAIYSSGNLLNKGFLFVITMMAARSLSSPIFGIFSLVKQSIATAVFISLIGLNYYILRDLNIIFKTGKGDTKNYLRDKLKNLIISLIITVLVISVFLNIYDDNGILSIKLKILIPLIIILNAFVIVQNSILSSYERFKITGIINSIISVIFFVLLYIVNTYFDLNMIFFIYFLFNAIVFICQDILLKEYSISNNIIFGRYKFNIVNFFKNLGIIYYNEILSLITITLFFFLVAKLFSLTDLANFTLYYQLLMACFLLPESIGSYFITSYTKSNVLIRLKNNLKISFYLSLFSFLLFLSFIPLIEILLNNKYDFDLNYYYLIFLLLIPFNFNSQFKKIFISKKQDKNLIIGQIFKSFFLILGVVLVSSFKLNSVFLIITFIIAETTSMVYFIKILFNKYDCSKKYFNIP